MTDTPETLLDSLPVAVFVEDGSDVLRYLESMRQAGVESFEAHLREHPEELAACVSKVKVIDVNRAALELYEAETKEALLSGLESVFDAQALERFGGVLAALAAGERTFDFETTNRTLRGRPIDVRLHFSLAGGRGDDWSRILVIATDISDRRRAQRSSEEIAERYRALVEDQPELMCRFRPDGRLTFVNRAYAEYFGKTPQECRGFDLFELIPESGRAQLRQHLADFSRDRPVSRIEHEVLRADGTIGWMQWTDRALFDGDGKEIIEFQSVGVDITDLKRVQSQLLLSEAKFRGIFEGCGVGIAIFDPGGRLIEANPAYEQFLGYEPDELVGRTTDSLTHEADRENGRRAVREVLEGHEKHASLEQRYLRRGGEVLWGLVTMSCIREEDGSPGYLIASLKDVTDQKRMEAERRRLEAQVREAQKLESLGLLAGGVAHDFNNLLTGVLGNADLAMRALPSGSPARQPLENIETTARRAADLANQMLAYSGRGRFVIETVDLSLLVEEMSRLARVSVTKRTSLRFDLDGTLPGIEADATQIRQVVLNLITNAAEAIGDREGVISIATGSKQCDTSYLLETVGGENLEPGEYVYVEVSDTGVGMTKEVQQRIFDPFFTTKFTGRGLGMAAVLGIARGHGAAVHVESVVGEGTSIRALFPASSKPKAEVTLERESEEVWKGEGTVLLVEDEAVVRNVAQRMLEHLGFDVMLAEDGVAGTEVFRRNNAGIRLVILDLAMPRMGGEEAFRLMREIRKDVPIVLSSGYNEQEVESTLIGAEAAGFIQKPYRLAALEKGVRQALGED